MLARRLGGALLAAGGVSGALAGGCGGGPRGVRPVATLATTTEAAIAFAPIRDAWATQTKAGRQQIRAPLERFLAQFPRDGEIPLAETYYVFILLDAGDVPRADFFLRALELSTPAGATRDLITVARAKELRMTRQPEQAFDLLRPLVGKLVEPSSRALFQEEVSLSALESHREYEAIAYMDAWLRNASEEDREAVKAKVGAALQTLQESVLEGSLRAMRSGGVASGYGRDIQRIVSERLAEVAIEKGDPDLARWLLDADSPALFGATEGPLAELATTRRGISSVDGRTIGLLLPTGSNDLRDEAADVMRGVAWALELPRLSTSDADATKLATRDDGGDPGRVAATMAELAGDGAAVVLAALDPKSADRAVQWGEEHAMPVIVLAVPETEHPRDYTFTVGQPRADELAALGAALAARGVTKAATLVEAGGDPRLALAAASGLTLLGPTDCDVDPAHAGEARFPIGVWRTERVRAWLVDGPPECASDLIHEASSATMTGVIALTLDAAGTHARAPGLTLLSAKAGAIPEVATRAEEVADPDLRRYFEREGVAPSFWTALGRDAGALARRAVAALPLDATADAQEVSRRRGQVKVALAAERVHLWTSDAEGMSGGHGVARALQIVELAGTEQARKGAGKR